MLVSILQESAVSLRAQLERLEEGRDSDSSYTDIMLYPRTSMILYRGSFLGLKFHGAGDLFHRRGSKVAYTGAWREGRIHGRGMLYAEDGDLLWKGTFKNGLPVRPWWVV